MDTMTTDSSSPSTSASPDPSNIALPSSPALPSPIGFSLIGSDDEDTHQRVDPLSQPRSVSSDDPAYSVPRQFPTFSSLTGAPPPSQPPPNPDFALMAFQTQASLESLVNAFRVVDANQAILEHQVYQAEQARLARQAGFEAGQVMVRSPHPQLFRFDAADGGTLRVDSRVVGTLSARGASAEGSSSDQRHARTEYEEKQRKLATVAAELRRAQRDAAQEQDQESTDRDEGGSAIRGGEASSRKKKKKGKKKKAATAVPTPAETHTPFEGGARDDVQEEMSDVERMIMQDWEDLAANQGQANFQKELDANEAKAAREVETQKGEEERLEDFGDLTVVTAPEKVEEVLKDRVRAYSEAGKKASKGKEAARKASKEVPTETASSVAHGEVDPTLLDSPADIKEKAPKSKKKAAKSAKQSEPSIQDVKSESSTTLPKSESTTLRPDSPEAQLSDSHTRVKVASATVFEQLGSSPQKASTGSVTVPTIAESASESTIEVSSAKDKTTGRDKYNAKKESRKLARAEKFKEDPRGSTVPSLASSQTSFAVKPSLPKTDAEAVAKKAAWKAEKRSKAKLAKSLPPPASMPAVSVPAGRVAPDDIGPPQTDTNPVAPPKTRPEGEHEPTPRPLQIRQLPDTEVTPIHPTLRLPTIQVQQEASPSARRPSLPPDEALRTSIADAVLRQKSNAPPTIITTRPSSTAMAQSESTLSVSIIEPAETSPAPLIFTFGSIGPDDAEEDQFRKSEEGVEHVQALHHIRSATAPSRDTAPDPRKSIAPYDVLHAARSRNVTSPAHIQYNSSEYLPAPITPDGRIAQAFMTPPDTPAIALDRTWETPIPGTPYLPALPQPIDRFTPLFPSLTSAVPFEAAQVPYDPANYPAPPERTTPEQTVRAVLPSSAPAVVAKRALVAPIRAGPLLDVLTNPGPSRSQASIIPRNAPPLGSSSTESEIVVRLPPTPPVTSKPIPIVASGLAPSAEVATRRSYPDQRAREDSGSSLRNIREATIGSESSDPQTSDDSIVISFSPPAWYSRHLALFGVAPTLEPPRVATPDLPMLPEVTSIQEDLVLAPSSPPPESAPSEITPEESVEKEDLAEPKIPNEASEHQAEVSTSTAPPALAEREVTGEGSKVQEVTPEPELQSEEPTAPEEPPVLVSTAATRPEAGNEPVTEKTSTAPIPPPSAFPQPPPGPLPRRPSALFSPAPPVPMTFQNHISRSFSVPHSRVTPPISILPTSHTFPRSPLSAAPISLPDLAVCPLARSWTLYYSDASAKAAPSSTMKDRASHYSGSLVPIFTASNLEDLFGRWKALRRLIAESTGRYIEPLGDPMDPRTAGLGIERFGEEKSFHFFTKGVLPMWEDPMAEKGGKMMFAGKPSEAAQVDFLFLQIVHLIVGGQIEHEAPVEEGRDSCVLGATLAKRKINVRVEIWLGGSEPPSAAWVAKVQSIVETSFPNWKIYPFKSFHGGR